MWTLVQNDSANSQFVAFVGFSTWTLIPNVRVQHTVKYIIYFNGLNCTEIIAAYLLLRFCLCASIFASVSACPYMQLYSVIVCFIRYYLFNIYIHVWQHLNLGENQKDFCIRYFTYLTYIFKSLFKNGNIWLFFFEIKSLLHLSKYLACYFDILHFFILLPSLYLSLRHIFLYQVGVCFSCISKMPVMVL